MRSMGQCVMFICSCRGGSSSAPTWGVTLKGWLGGWVGVKVEVKVEKRKKLDSNGGRGLRPPNPPLDPPLSCNASPRIMVCVFPSVHIEQIV